MFSPLAGRDEMVTCLDALSAHFTSKWLSKKRSSRFLHPEIGVVEKT
jgi:hypothetical protein